MLSFSSPSLQRLASPSLSCPLPDQRTRFHPPRSSASASASAAAATRSTARNYRYSYAFDHSADQNGDRNSFASLTSPQSMATATCTSLYEVLGIPVGATGQEIKTAYRRLALTRHPDVVAIDRKDSSAGEFMKIHAAYCTLSDPEKRAVYDRKLFRRNISRPLTSASGGYSGRNWETDQCW